MKKILFILCMPVLIWGGAFLWFYGQIPSPEVQQHFGEQKDAIVVLTGGTGRFGHGLQLLVDGRATELLISGVDKDVRPHELVEMYGIETNHPALATRGVKIALDHGPDNTVGNARSTAIWARQNHFDSLYLVTSGYHMPRSLMEFQHAMPEIEVIPEPVFPEREQMEPGWFTKAPLRLVWLEFHKYIARQLYYLLPESWQVLDIGVPETPDISLMTLGGGGEQDSATPPAKPTSQPEETP